nr:type II toxin-antitoxin system YoeB family toxin [Leptolyngbya sp. FACHB-17]
MSNLVQEIVLAGFWSRRIDETHHLVYAVFMQ